MSNSNKNSSINVFYAGKKLRGFHRHLIQNPPRQIYYKIANANQNKIFFETKPWYHDFFLKLWHSKIGDQLGLIQKINIPINECDLVQTYNRFAKSSKPYLIYLENPTALFHYELGRSKSFIGQKVIKSSLNDNHLKAIVCMSKICLKTLDLILPCFPSRILKEQIYPYVSLNPYVNKEIISARSYKDNFKCLYISSNFTLKGGREILEAIEKVYNNFFYNIELTIVTKKNTIPPDTLNKIRYLQYIKLLEFDQSYDDLQKLYANSNILLHPTLKDSFGIVILEAIKSGLPVLTTDLYAIPELVKDEYNGFLLKPPVRYFSKKGVPNPKVWRKDNLLIKNIPYQSIVDFLFEKLSILINDRNKLNKISLNSWKVANEEPLSCKYIHGKWQELYGKIIKKGN